VTGLDGTMALLEKSSEGRVTAATAMNKTSSRSHAIFTLTVEARPGPTCAVQGVTVSKVRSAATGRCPF
jgi:hypothetical protein